MTISLAPSTRRILRLALGVLAAITILASFRLHYLFTYPSGVDLEIPLRAAERWATGGHPYLASSFGAPPGPTQPFLYPPYVLPLLAPLVGLPRYALELAWTGVCLLAALWVLWRLAVPFVAWPLALLWAPILEPVIGGNIQIVLFAAFIAIFYTRRPDPGDVVGPGHGRRWMAGLDWPPPRPRDLGLEPGPYRRLGFLGGAIGAVKVSQPFAWLYLARCRPFSAIAGALPFAALALVTLLLTGVQPWLDWAAQLSRAGDPTWDLAGFAVARASPVLGIAVSLAAVAALWFVPRRDAGPWVGVLMVVGTPSLQIFGLLFLVPALLTIRREIALLAVMSIATTSYIGMWAGILVVTITLLASLRLPWLMEPTREMAADKPAGSPEASSVSADVPATGA